MSAKDKIRSLFNKEKELTVKEIVIKLSVSKQMVHLVLNKLMFENFIEKLGRAPRTIYRLKDQNILNEPSVIPIINEEKGLFLDRNFLVITEFGQMLEGIEAFNLWCDKRNQDTLKTLEEYIKTKKRYGVYYDESGIINGSDKLQRTYADNTFLDEIYYLDFYAIERFGKTRLGVLLHFAKQGQNVFLMTKMMNEIREKIFKFIKDKKVDAVAFVPPTIRREVQIMKFVKENLKLSLPIVDIQKISGIIPIPQKSLQKLDERINNARNSFALTDQRQFKKILLIDDAVGSGATMNQIAEKIKNKSIGKSVIGLAIVGSFKGFDVINDI